MASDKLKRFRVHVVKELYETERDYTTALEFTVMYILEKAREKHSYDNTFTEHHIKTLFCNMEEILDFHRRLLEDLSACIGSKGPAYDTQIAQCYLKNRKSFDLYRVYGENNEHAQKLLHELGVDQAMKAFFVACMLLGGKGDDDISSYLFKPIQRVCKYPLLFRELIKYTPTSHPDYAATSEALDMMRDVCSVINEARRRVEKLEAIADWQATVDGWEGSNVTDTCNELVKEGPLIKISAGNTQERFFFLFDNLFVYCKKSTILGGKTRLLFRGRIAVESLNVEDLQDGSCDYYTNGIHVTNSWKVNNISKNKWFVLIAKSHEQKQFWMDAIRRVKENRKREQAGRASNTRNVILSKGEKIYHLITADHLPKDHKVRLKTCSNSFTGRQFVKWLILRNEVQKDEEGVILGQALLENGVIHHVSDRHQFKNSEYVYRFRYDDNSFRGKLELADLSARSVRIYCRLHSLFDPLVKEQRVGIRSIPCVVVSQKLIDWWHSEKDISRRVDGITLGEEFFATGVLRHITDEHKFKDGQFLYRFTADDAHEGLRERERRFTLSSSRVEFGSMQTFTCRTIAFRCDVASAGYGVELTEIYPITIKSLTSRTQTMGVSVGDIVHSINGRYITPANVSECLADLMTPDDPATPPLHLLVEKKPSHTCTLVPTKTGLGFHIKGSSPVVISDIDKDSAASRAGLTIGSCVLKVGEKEVVRMKHDEIVTAVMKTLEETVKTEGGRRVELKLSLPFMEHVGVYQYESIQNAPVDVYERNVESPYVFSIPAQLMKLYADELVQMVKLVSSAAITDVRVLKYLEEIKAVAALYLKTKNTLSQPKWPSYKLHGVSQSKFLDCCPTNLHTSVMGVAPGSESNTTPNSPSNGSLSEQSMTESVRSISVSTSERSMSESEDDFLAPPTSHTSSYCISTMQIPMEEEFAVSKEDMSCLDDVQIRREFLHNLVERVREMINDVDSLKRMIPDLRKSPTHSIPNGGNSLNLTDDLTPAVSPSQSPILGHRSRTMSVSNPEPMIRLLGEGLIRKGTAMEGFLEDKLLCSILEDADGIVKQNHRDVLERFKERLRVLSGELVSCSKRPGEALLKSARIFVETVERHVEELCIHLWVSLILCDRSPLLESVDKLFSQALTATVTAFAHQLSLALRGELNPGVEYGDSNANSSRQWLQMVGKKGVLAHFEGTMLPKEDSELRLLQGFSLVLGLMDRVAIFIQPSSSTSPPPLLSSELPPVTLEGGHESLSVHIHLPPSTYAQLPDDMKSGNGIKIHTVLFNKGLLDLEEGHDAYTKEKSLNTKGLKSLEAYYKHIRAFRLDKANLPCDSDAKTLAINKISVPLNAMDFLMRQIRIAVHEPTRPGAGLLTLASELATRMGALRVNFCDSGVYRSVLASSLEHVMVLGRCHGLPFKSFRSTLNAMRREGRLVDIIRKNQADTRKSLPKQPLKLFQLPSDPTEASVKP